MMLFRRDAYQAIGGYESVGSSIVDDNMLARRIKAAGLCWRVTNDTDLITCRMYGGSRAAFDGFSKNFLPLLVFTC
jgi:chlorobactene glucosyltransferase